MDLQQPLDVPAPSRLGCWGRGIVLLNVGLFVVSTALPVIASLIPVEQFPAWLGIFDAALAAVVILLAGVLDWAGREQISTPTRLLSYRFYRGAASLPLILLVIFFVVGDQIRWDVLLAVLAWRAWVLLYSLPAALALWVWHPTPEQ